MANGNEKISIVETVAEVDTTYNGRKSYVGLYIKEGQFGQFFSIEKHGQDMMPKYLSLTLNKEHLKKIGEELVRFASKEQQEQS